MRSFEITRGPMSTHSSNGRGDLTRRKFLIRSGDVAAATVVALAVGGDVLAADEKPPQAGESRASRAFDMRVTAAKYERDEKYDAQKTNGDEARYEKKWGSYSKALPHNELGEVDGAAYRAYVHCLETGRAEDLEQIPLGGYLKLSNPHAAFAYDLVGPDSHQMTIPAPPPLDSEDLAGEMVELYWKALLRDVPFDQYETHELSGRAQAELSSIGRFCGPRGDGKVTAGTLCRGASPGGRIGPYVSQFFLRDVPWSPMRVPQRIRTAVAGKDYLTNASDWLAMENGGLAGVNTFDDQARYIRSGRDLGEYVHRDFTYQAFLGAALI